MTGLGRYGAWIQKMHLGELKRHLNDDLRRRRLGLAPYVHPQSSLYWNPSLKSMMTGLLICGRR